MILVVTSVTMLFHDRLEPRPIGRLNPITAGSLWLLALVTAASAGSVFLEAGFNLFLPDNPTGYQLLGG